MTRQSGVALVQGDRVLPDPRATSRIPLSTPHLGDEEERLVLEALRSNWIAPLGPMVDAFEAEFAARVGSPHAVALSSGTAALHLALIGLGVGPGDEVLVSTLTFAGSVNPIVYLGARPVLLDSEPESWNLDPSLLESALAERARLGRLPRAVVPVHLYGQPANLPAIMAICDRHGVPVIEDAAESLGATCGGRDPGTFGRAGVFSFNGNKVITTSGGGMLVTPDASLAALARKLATQARDPAPHYQHSMIGYNYRLSNLLAALGRGQLRQLDQRVAARQANFAAYQAALGQLPGVSLMPEAPWGRHSRWLTTLTLDPDRGLTPARVSAHLDALGIECRPVWKPMHLQPIFAGCEVVGGAVSERLFREGLCLPSGSNLSVAERDRVIAALQEALTPGG